MTGLKKDKSAQKIVNNYSDYWSLIVSPCSLQTCTDEASTLKVAAGKAFFQYYTFRIGHYALKKGSFHASALPTHLSSSVFLTPTCSATAQPKESPSWAIKWIWKACVSVLQAGLCCTYLCNGYLRLCVCLCLGRNVGGYSCTVPSVCAIVNISKCLQCRLSLFSNGTSSM